MNTRFEPVSATNYMIEPMNGGRKHNGFSNHLIASNWYILQAMFLRIILIILSQHDVNNMQMDGEPIVTYSGSTPNISLTN
jgi:hypothetical protein